MIKGWYKPSQMVGLWHWVPPFIDATGGRPDEDISGIFEPRQLPSGDLT